MTAPLPEIVDQTAILAFLRCEECLHIDQLSLLSGYGNRGVVKAVGKLVARGFAERREVGCFVLTEAGEAWRKTGKPITSGTRRIGPTKQRRRRHRTIRDRVWDALRIRQKASTPEILELVGVSTEAEAGSVRRYMRFLARGGYLRELAKREAGTSVTSNGFKRFALIHDTGPKAPRQNGNRAIYDPNTDEVRPLGASGRTAP